MLPLPRLAQTEQAAECRATAFTAKNYLLTVNLDGPEVVLGEVEAEVRTAEVVAVDTPAPDLAPAIAEEAAAASTADTALFSSAAVTTAMHTVTTTMASIMATRAPPDNAMCVTLSAFARHSIEAPPGVWSVPSSEYFCVSAVSASFALASAEAQVVTTEVLHRAHGPAAGVTAAMVVANTAASSAFIITMLLWSD